MKIKEFEALTLKECLNQVRRELGPEAVILETRKFRKGGILGWGSREAVRIVAGTGISVNDNEAGGRGRQERAADSGGGQERGGGQTRDRRAPAEPAAQKANARAYASESPRAAGERDNSLRAADEDSMNPSGPLPTRRDVTNAEAFFARHAAGATLERPTEQSRSEQSRSEQSGSEQDQITQEKFQRLEKEMREIRDGIASLRHSHAVVSPISTPSYSMAAVPPVPYPELYKRLRRAEVNEELAIALINQIPDLTQWAAEARGTLAEQALRDIMGSRVKTAGPIDITGPKPKIIAFIGPTGVGKTTTIAKLAAQFALIQKKKVGLITMDTYRIAAVEQLKTYSQIIDIPVEVAYSQADVAPALAKFKGCDLILIDTAGRSQKNIMQVSELKTLVDNAGCETHLVLAASTKERDLLDQVQRFAGAGVDRLLFTKLDETTTYGTMYSVAAHSGIPVSYLATGQKVPEDIEAATGPSLATMVTYSAAA